MLVKTFVKLMCVSALGTGVFTLGTSQGVAQQSLEDPGYGLHRQGMQKKDEKKSESGLEFTADDLNRWMLRQKRAVSSYDRRVSELQSGDSTVDRAIRAIRIAYSLTPDYDPFSTSTIKKLTFFAYTADMSEDPTEVNQALEDYRELLYRHLGNLDVIDYALTLARANPIYGDALRLKEIRDALRKDILSREMSGESPEEAYRVMTYGEETFLLGERNVTVDKSEIFRVNDKFYNVHDVTLSDGTPSQLFFDVTSPIYNYEKTKALAESKTDLVIPAQ